MTASCGAPAGGFSIEGVDVAKETVIQGAVSRDGRRQTVSDWTATYSGTAHVIGGARMKPQDIDRLIIRTPDGRTLLSLPS